MAYIRVEEGVAGIRSLVLFRPETGKHLYDLAQVLLRGPSPLTEAERELIAAYVSNRNDCMFCMNSHAAAARCLYGEEKDTVDDVLQDMEHSPVSDKMKALLNIAGKVSMDDMYKIHNACSFALASDLWQKVFAETLETGMQILDTALVKNAQRLDGDTAFKLYDTFGFPIDLTADIGRERDFAMKLARGAT